MIEEKRQPIIIGSKKGGGGGASEADDTLFARHQAGVIDLVSEGEIVGLVNGASSIFFNETRLFDKNTGASNFKGVSTIEKYGTQDQSIPTSFLSDFSTSSITQDFSGNGKLELDTPQFLKITTGSIERALSDYLKVSIFTDAMYKVDKEGDNTGDVLGSVVSFDIDFIYYNAAGTQTVKAFQSGFNGKCGSKYVHTFGIDTEQYQPFTDWEVKVTRVGGDVSSDAYKVFNNIYCGIIESQITDKLEYPHSAYVGIKLDAEAFGTSVPTRSYDLKGVKISVPTNYFSPDSGAAQLTLTSATNFAVGDAVSSNETITALTSDDDINEGLRATATVGADHGVPIGETFSATISGATVGSGTNYYNGTFVCKATSSTTFTYEMSNDPGDNSASGTIVMTLGTGTVQSKSGDVITIRDTGRRFLKNSTIYDSNNHTGNNTTITAVSYSENTVNFGSYKRNVSSGAIETTDQVWDGNFYTSWTNNPAWIYYDLLTNKRYGLGNYISTDDIDKWELYAIARYCDELVADPTDSTGNTTEPRFTCNLYLTKATEAYKVLQDLAAVFRGMQFWMNGTIVPIQDREKDPVYQFTQANVIDGQFEYSGTSKKTRHNMAKVSYNNPNNFFKQTVEYVQDDELLSDDNSFAKVKNISAFGCTSRGQALRLGKWVLATEKLNYETVTFSTGLNASFVRPGDVINVQDARRQNIGYSGRVAKPSTSAALVTNGTFGSNITGWTQGTATAAHDTTNKRIKLTSGGSAQTPRAYQSLGTLTNGRTYRVKARAYHGQTADSDQYAKVYISTATNGTGEVTTGRAGTYRTNSATETFIDFTIPAASTATHYLQVEGSNLDNTEFVSFDSIEVYQVNTVNSVTIDRDLDIIAGQTYSLTLTKPGYIAKLAQDTATISSVAYVRGDILAGTSYDTQEESQQVRDDSNNLVHVDWSPYIYSETNNINNSAATDVSILTTNGSANAFSVVPDDETIWILQRTTAANELKTQQYTVLAVAEDGENKLSISGLKYNASKYDHVDKLEPLETARTINAPLGDHEIPPPTNLIVVPTGEAGPAGTVQDLLTVSWSPPKVNTSGVYDPDPATAANNVLPYEFIKGYQVKFRHDDEPSEDFNLFGIVTPNTVDIVQPREATYTFQIRTVNMNNQLSAPLETSVAVVPSSGIAKNETSVSQINTGGKLDTSITLSTSNVTFGSTTPTVTNALGTIKTAASNPGTLAFAGLANSGVGYVYWDFSAGTITAKVRNATNKTWYTLGGSEFANASGTVSCTAGSEDHKITGSSTNFDGDFSVGAKIRVNNTDVETYTVQSIESDTVMFVTEPIVVTRSGVASKKESFVPDYVNDVVLATVTENAGGNAWTIEIHAVEAGIEGSDGQGIRVAQLFKKNDDSFGTSSAGTFADPTDSVEAGWTLAQPALTADEDKVYMVSRIFTSDGASPQAGSWTSPVIIAQREDGAGGTAAKKATSGILYYQVEAASAPSAPSVTNVRYTFATGVFSNDSGSVIGTSGTTWNRNPPTSTGGATTSKSYYVTYNAVEDAAAGGVSTGGNGLTFDSTVKQATAFNNLVTFSNGDFELNGSGITTIDGSNIATGQIESTTLTSETSTYTSAGALFDLSNAEIKTPYFYSTNSGAGFKGTVTISGTNLTSGNTLNANTVGSDLGTGYGDSSIGGLTLAASKIYIGTGTQNNANTAFYVDNSGNFSLKDKLNWDGTTLSINGNITMANAGSINISGFNNNSGFTNDDAADAAQDTADGKTTANAAASAANSAAKTDGTVGGWTLNSTSLTGGSGVHIKSGQTAYNSGTGFYLGNDSGTPKFSIGNAGTNAITWDGSTMTIRGTLQLASGTAPTANQTDAEALVASNAGANSQAKTDGSVGGWSLNSSTISSTNITLDNTNARILISD